MLKENIVKAASKLRYSIGKHSPEILVGLGICGMILTTVAAVRATPKALKLLEEKRQEKEDKDVLQPIEIVKTTWKCYIPSAIIGGVSIACILGANAVNTRRTAALAAAYSLSENALREYRKKIVETIGEQGDTFVREAVAKEKLEKNPLGNQEIFGDEKAEHLCYDPISGRYFKSHKDIIKRAENELNRQILNDLYIPLNDFYYEIGLSNATVGELLGWHVDDGYIEIAFSSQVTENGTPCLVLDYRVAPRYGYNGR